MRSLLRLVNRTLSGFGETQMNILKFGVRKKIDRAEFRRISRLKNILVELTDEGIGTFSKIEVEELIRKKIMK